MRLTLALTTYERPDALAAVFDSLSAQSRAPDEVIVADDGSGAATRALIESFTSTAPYPVHPVRQEHEGFRVARLRNLAIARAAGDYVVFIDGDMVLHPEFIADHRRFARPGTFTQGVRIPLDAAATNAVIAAAAAENPARNFTHTGAAASKASDSTHTSAADKRNGAPHTVAPGKRNDPTRTPAAAGATDATREALNATAVGAHASEARAAHNSPHPSPRPTFAASGRRSLYALHSPLLSTLTRRVANSFIAIKSCNQGFWRADLVAVNGFDEAFVGWGSEDKELCARLQHHGTARQTLLFGGIAFHLHHPPAGRERHADNERLLAESRAAVRVRCARGLDAHLRPML